MLKQVREFILNKLDEDYDFYNKNHGKLDHIYSMKLTIVPAQRWEPTVQGGDDQPVYILVGENWSGFKS